ncbi:MAG: TonB-dependent receptor [Pseudomonadota bacterium]
MSKFPVLATTLSLAALLVTGFAPTHASAQQQDDNDDGVLEELVVTAQRRSSNLQDVPVAVTALDGNALERRNVLSTEDVFTEVPGLIGSNNVGQSTAVTFFLRGIGTTESIVTVDPAVGVYVDDVYIARQGVNNFGLYDIERIEVLRGPQGTLYGRNSSAGAVRVVTKKPTFETEGRINLVYGNYSRFEARASFNTPIVDDKLAIRMNMLSAQHSGYSDNITLSTDVNDMNFFGARVSALYTPNADLNFIFTADFMEDDSNSVYPSNLATLPTEPSSDSLFTLFSDTEQSNVGETWGMSLTGEWIAGDRLTLKSITSYRRTLQKYNLDLSDSITPIYELFTDNDSEQVSQEFTATGTLGGGAFDYTAGVYYFNEDSTSFLGNEFNLRVPPNFDTIPAIFNEQFIQTDSESLAVYGELTWNFSDRWSAFAGGRLTSEEKTFATQFFTGRTPIGFNATGGTLVFDTTAVTALGTPVDLDFDEFTPRIGLTYAIADNVNSYASISRGFKSGGWLARLVFPTPDEIIDFPPEIVDSYELGLKAQWFGNRVRTNVAVFYTDFQDLFNTFTNVNGGFSGATTDAEISGLEFEGTWRVNEWLDIFGNVAIMDGEYAGGIEPELAAILGDDLQRLPELQGKLGLSVYYPLAADRGTLRAGFDYSYIGDHFTAITNAPVSETGYEIANASFGWERADGRFGVTLSCRNCFDEEYFHSLLDFSGLGFAPAYPGEPRFYMINFEANL